MTPFEHQLIVEMFKMQNQAFAALVEALKSQGIVQKGDLAAYDQLIVRSESGRSLLDSQVEEAYQGFATVLGVETGLPLEDE
jgi:hypothetical protein